MNGLEEHADNAKARDLSYWKPLSWLGTILPSSANVAFDPNLWATFSLLRCNKGAYLASGRVGAVVPHGRAHGPHAARRNGKRRPTAQ